jgi:phenylpropionate dioxygenase-like ring-hydroxylating dioxygenase large terminal subunit
MNAPTWNYQPISEADRLRLGVDPVPAAPYYDPEWFELEREAIFKRTWLNIGHISEIAEPGSFMVRPVEVAKASILIVHGKDGEIRAFHNVCTHRGTQLVARDGGKASSFSCPYHAWTFGYDGELRSAPDFERFYVDKADCSLRKVSVDVCAGLIFINLDPAPAQGLREFLGPMGEMAETLPVAHATTFDEYVYEIDANWKVTFDNFQENYHVRFVHRRSAGAPPIDSTPNPFSYPVKYELFGPHRMDTSPSGDIPNDSPKPVSLFALGKLAEQVAADGLLNSEYCRDYFVFFPNLYLFGSPVMHFTHLVMPISVDRSRGVFRFYWAGDARSASERLAREMAMAFGREIHAEDGETIEQAQRGLSSGALKNLNFQEHEVLCRHLLHVVDNMVRDYQSARKAVGARA